MIKVLVDGREMVVDLDKNLVMSADGKPIPADSPLVEKAKQAAQKLQQPQQQQQQSPKVAAAADKLQNHATKANAEQVGKVAGTLAAAGGAMAGSAAAVRNAADPNSGLARDDARIQRAAAARQEADSQRNRQIASRDERKEADKDAAAQAASQYQQTMSQISGAAGGGAAALAAMNVQKGDPNQHRQRADEAHKNATVLSDAADANKLNANASEKDANDADKLASDAATQNIKSSMYSIAPDYGAASEGNGEQNPAPGNGGEQTLAPEQTPSNNGEQTPGNNGEQTPGNNGEQTPSNNGEQTPGNNGEQTPGNNGEQTPGNNGEQTPGTEQQPTPAPAPGTEQQPAPGEQNPAPGNGEQQPAPGNGDPGNELIPSLGFTLNDAQVGYTEAVGKQSGATATSEEGKNRAIEYFKKKGVSENGDPNDAGAELQEWRRLYAGDSVDAVGNTTYKDASRMTGGETVVVKSDRRLKNILTAINRRFY